MIKRILVFLFFCFFISNVFAYTSIKEVSFYISNNGVTGYILLTANSSINLSNIIPEGCKFYKLVSVVPIKIVGNSILLNSTESFIIEFQCTPKKLENDEYYLNVRSTSDLYNGSSLFIYLLDNIKLINLTPRFSIYNSTIYNDNITNLKFSLTYKIYGPTTEANTEEPWFIFIIILINLAYVIIILYVLKTIAKRFKKPSKEDQERLLSLCNTKFEREIVKFLLKNKGQSYQYEISKNLNIDKSTVSKILKRLEDRNIITREDGEKGILVKINHKFNH